MEDKKGNSIGGKSSIPCPSLIGGKAVSSNKQGAADAPPKKKNGPGRPRKNPLPVATGSAAPKKRGLPRKNPECEPEPKKRRGRPPKAKAPASAAAPPQQKHATTTEAASFKNNYDDTSTNDAAAASSASSISPRKEKAARALLNLAAASTTNPETPKGGGSDSSPHKQQQQKGGDTSMRKKPPPLPPCLLSVPAQQVAEGQAAVVVGSNAPDTTPTNKNEDECVCDWGESCAKFRRYFERIKEKEGQCIFAGSFCLKIPKRDSAWRHINFLDAVDRHLKTSQGTKQRPTGRKYVIALHHWSKEVLEYAIQHHNHRDLLKPVNRDIAQALGIIDEDPRNRFTPRVVRDGNGRMRPDRTKGFPSQEQWMMAPKHSLESVKQITDEFVAKEIRERFAQIQESKRQAAAATAPEANAAATAVASPSAEAAATSGQANSNQKDARILELEQELAEKKRELAKAERELAKSEREFAQKEMMHEEQLAAARDQLKKLMADL